VTEQVERGSERREEAPRFGIMQRPCCDFIIIILLSGARFRATNSHFLLRLGTNNPVSGVTTKPTGRRFYPDRLRRNVANGCIIVTGGLF
jgi:hypothetical protein